MISAYIITIGIIIGSFTVQSLTPELLPTSIEVRIYFKKNLYIENKYKIKINLFYIGLY